MVALTVFAAQAACAETENFDSKQAGAMPAGWLSGVTGHGAARWIR